MTNHLVHAVPSAWTGMLPTKEFAVGYIATIGMWISGDEVVRIQDGRDLLLSVKYGSVWITQAGSIKDVFIGAGESFRLERDGRTLVSLGATGSRAVITLMRSSRAGPLERLASGAQRLSGTVKAWSHRRPAFPEAAGGRFRPCGVTS